MASSTSTTLVWDEDTTKLKAMIESLKFMDKNHIQYGILNKDKYPVGDDRAGQYVAQIALEHEFGLKENLPPRPFFTQSVHRHGKKLARQISRHLLGQALNRQIDETDLKINADLLADTVRETIDEQDFWSLSPMTVSKKNGNTTILRDTDTMYDALKGKAVRGKIPNEGT